MLPNLFGKRGNLDSTGTVFYGGYGVTATEASPLLTRLRGSSDQH